jgi:hypothetical protein
VVHKYNFPKLLTRLMAFVKMESNRLSYTPDDADYVVRWLALAQRVQLDALRELCLGRLWDMGTYERKMAMTVWDDEQKKRSIREEVKQLGQEQVAALLEAKLLAEMLLAA